MKLFSSQFSWEKSEEEIFATKQKLGAQNMEAGPPEKNKYGLKIKHSNINLLNPCNFPLSSTNFDFI